MTILELDRELLASLDLDDPAPLTRTLGTLPDEFREFPTEGTGQYPMYARYLEEDDFVLVGSETWMRILDIERDGDRLAVIGRRETGHPMILHVRAARSVRVWHTADVAFAVAFGKSAGVAL
jgi:hypothetical protein